MATSHPFNSKIMLEMQGNLHDKIIKYPNQIYNNNEPFFFFLRRTIFPKKTSTICSDHRQGPTIFSLNGLLRPKLFMSPVFG